MEWRGHSATKVCFGSTVQKFGVMLIQFCEQGQLLGPLVAEYSPGGGVNGAWLDCIVPV